MNTEPKLINPSVTVLTSVDELKHQLHICELAGRLCYDSTERLTEEASPSFLTRLIDKHHESVLEHAHLSVIFTTDRATTHQLVRHRLCSFSQQSQRYCRYEEGGKHQLLFIDTGRRPHGAPASTALLQHLGSCAKTYDDMLSDGCAPEEARAVLPNCTATTICVTANIREWRHIFNERLAPAAQWDIKVLMFSLYRKLELNGFGHILSDIFVDPKLLSAEVTLPDCTMTQDTYKPNSYEKPHA